MQIAAASVAAGDDDCRGNGSQIFIESFIQRLQFCPFLAMQQFGAMHFLSCLRERFEPGG